MWDSVQVCIVIHPWTWVLGCKPNNRELAHLGQVRRVVSCGFRVEINIYKQSVKCDNVIENGRTSCARTPSPSMWMGDRQHTRRCRIKPVPAVKPNKNGCWPIPTLYHSTPCQVGPTFTPTSDIVMAITLVLHPPASPLGIKRTPSLSADRSPDALHTPMRLCSRPPYSRWTRSGSNTPWRSSASSSLVGRFPARLFLTHGQASGW